jgi:hypothetical protein
MGYTLEQARAAKEKAKRLFTSNVGVGITRIDDGYAVKVNLRNPMSKEDNVPTSTLCLFNSKSWVKFASSIPNLGCVLADLEVTTVSQIRGHFFLSTGKRPPSTATIESLCSWVVL